MVLNALTSEWKKPGYSCENREIYFSRKSASDCDFSYIRIHISNKSPSRSKCWNFYCNWDTYWEAEPVDVPFESTIQVGECRDCHHQPSSHICLTSRRSGSRADWVEYRQWLQHVSTPDYVGRQLLTSCQSQIHEADAVKMMHADHSWNPSKTRLNNNNS
jgi:hypothetical protein